MQSCEVCHLGVLRTVKATYAGWHHGYFVMLPSVDASLCDVCGDFAYDSDTIIRIETLLGIKQNHSIPAANLPNSIEAVSHPIPRSRST